MKFTTFIIAGVIALALAACSPSGSSVSADSSKNNVTPSTAVTVGCGLAQVLGAAAGAATSGLADANQANRDLKNASTDAQAARQIADAACAGLIKVFGVHPPAAASTSVSATTN